MVVMSSHSLWELRKLINYGGNEFTVVSDAYKASLPDYQNTRTWHCTPACICTHVTIFLFFTRHVYVLQEHKPQEHIHAETGLTRISKFFALGYHELV
jgi:hypothetical protein